MIKEKLDEALIAMDHALAPKNTEGLIEPMEFFNEPPKEMVVPYFDPMANGGLDRPMCFADEFTDGKLPPDFKSVKGYAQPPEFVSRGNFFGNYTYSEPEYNLPTTDRIALITGREALAQQTQQKVLGSEKNPSAMLDLKEHVSGTLPESEKDDSSMITSDLTIYEFSGGMYVICDGQKVTICNFRLQVTQHRRVHINPHTCEDEYQINVLCNQNCRTITVPARDLDNLIKRIQREIPMCTVATTFRRVSAMIVNFVRNKIPDAETYDVFCYTGFVWVGGRWVYAHDFAAPPNNHVIFDTGRSISKDPHLSVADSFLRAREFLNITPRDDLIVPLFLLAHLGPLFELFKAAGFVPRFVPFLNGRTGSFKTALSLCLYHLFDQQQKVPEASFRDTVVALELKLGQANGHVLLVDDFQPAVSAVAGKQNLEKLEAVIRFVGDGIGKSRGGPELELRKTPPPAGCCLVTGEDTGGSQSSLLRCIVIPIAKGDIDGQKLKVFQEHPEILQTHMYHFLSICGEHAQSIIDTIRREFTNYRDMFSTFVHEARLADAGATLLLVAKILLDYAKTIPAINQEDNDQLFIQFADSIKKALVYSESYSREMNPTAMYLRALFDLYERGNIPLAGNPAVYNSSKHVGYMYEGNWWLRNRDIFPKVTSYWQLLNVIFPLREDKILESLADSGLIEVDYESRDGKQKRLFGRRSSIEGRPRMMVLRIQRSQEYLTKELGEF